MTLDAEGGGIAALKRDLDGTLLLVASPSLARTVSEAGLVDEYHLAIQPIFAGHGPTFLTGLSELMHLRLTDAKRLPSGVAIHRYRAGAGSD